MLSTNEMIISIVFAVSLAGILAYVFWIQRKQAKQGLVRQPNRKALLRRLL